MIALSASATSTWLLPFRERAAAPIGPYIPGAIAAPLLDAEPARSPAAARLVSPSATLAHHPPGRPTGPPNPPGRGFGQGC
ncbi:hypothetical protein MPS_1178 [Mycobacterium pseudoshottsii JCM 15466]|nr:hypothetical protein [Mycobacterium pseudoshottsii]GAQ32798.1 hypothetical protein MPS_1178 [Mycobacterium pseudoshottsii JCM 15466]